MLLVRKLSHKLSNFLIVGTRFKHSPRVRLVVATVGGDQGASVASLIIKRGGHPRALLFNTHAHHYAPQPLVVASYPTGGETEATLVARYVWRAICARYWRRTQERMHQLATGCRIV